MKTVLLAGGLGTRLREETEFRPKPMVPVGGKPILWHIMKTFAHFGHDEFVVCTGYRGDSIRQYFYEFEAMNSDFTVKLGSKERIKTHGVLEEAGWEVTVADTGAETMTGGRIYKIRDHVGKDSFLCTYGDGLADVDISKLLKFHKSHGKVATLTEPRFLESWFAKISVWEKPLCLRFLFVEGIGTSSTSRYSCGQLLNINSAMNFIRLVWPCSLIAFTTAADCVEYSEKEYPAIAPLAKLLL